jgi:hypothetical protein
MTGINFKNGSGVAGLQVETRLPGGTLAKPVSKMKLVLVNSPGTQPVCINLETHEFMTTITHGHHLLIPWTGFYSTER